jgi:hypothetical protein
VNGFAAGVRKRKGNTEAIEEPETKRSRLENDHDESEEGEVEE